MRRVEEERLVVGGPEPARYFLSMVTKARADAIERALTEWSKPYGSIEAFAAKRGLVVTTRVEREEWTVTVAAVPLDELPSATSKLTPDGSALVRVEVLLGPAAFRAA